MSKNEGKIFEDDIRNSVPNYAKLLRLPDPPHSFTQRSDTKFSKKNPYDYECFDSIRRTLYCWELKSTHQKYIGFQTSEKDNREVLIKWHQIEGLTKAAQYKNVVSGFLLNFRLDNGEQLVYFFDIKNFNKMRKNINKKSLNIMDAVLYGAVRINGYKKRTRWSWNIDEFLQSQTDEDI